MSSTLHSLVVLVLLSGCGSAMVTSDDGSTSATASSTTSQHVEDSRGQATASSDSPSSSSSDEAGTFDPDETSSTSEDGSSTSGERTPADPGCPECIVLVDELVSGRGLVVDDSYVYFTDQSQGIISRIMKDGGDGGVIVEGQDAPYDIAVDATHVYWTNLVEDGAVMRAPKEGGRPEVVAMAIRPRTVAVDETHVYWGTFDSVDGDVYRRVLGLDEPEELLASMFGGISALVLGDDQIYWTAHAEVGSVGFIANPKEEPIGGVFSAALDGSADPFEYVTLADGQAQPWGIARTPSGQLLWANGDGPGANLPNTIMMLSVAGAAAPLDDDSAAPWGVAADATFAFWTDNDRVMALPFGEDATIQLAEQQNGARSIDVDEDHVFWITRTRVLQRAKPAR